eukprot:maker-scaffold45_size475391-snap-gene-1.12 protein:Tk10513 transcript:maker-scaffold45_size475391-snap-gene-1.12-mRNA-1 annotation:"an1-type zinc finger protein 4-like"
MSDFESDLEDQSDDIIEICVESLVGTIFEMRLSRYETVGSIKSRLQRLEGIPKNHMHLLFLGNELSNASSLDECQVGSGSTLKLILALRGGPINTRRIPIPSSASHNQIHPDRVPSDIRDLMMRNRDQLLDKMPENGQVTVLLFREGDQVNLYHVMERPDGTFSPFSDSWSNSSVKNLFYEDDPNLDKEGLEERLKMNAVTMNKMSDLRNQLQSLNMKKEKRKKRRKAPSGKSSASNSAASSKLNHQYPAPPSSSPPSSRRRRRALAGHVKPSPRNSAMSQVGESQLRRPRSTTKKERGTQRAISMSSARPQENMLFQESIQAHKGVPLPPINQTNLHQDFEMDDLDLTSTTTSIQPLPNQGPSQGQQGANIVSQARQRSLSRQSSLSTNLPMMRHNPMSTVPEWLQKSDPTSCRSSALPAAKEDIFNRDIDVIDLKLNQHDPGVEILRRRKTQKLITADINNLNRFDQVKGSRTRSRQRTTSSMASMSGPEEDIFIPDVPATHTPDFLAGSSSSFKRDRIFTPGNDSAAKTKATHAQGRNSSRLSKHSDSGPAFTTGRPGSTSAKSGRRRKKTPKPRCSDPTCKKKLNITNGFPCRCQKVFCAKHRHAELHDCTYDYKKEGRKILERDNPVITLPKLPKI